MDQMDPFLAAGPGDPYHVTRCSALRDSFPLGFTGCRHSLTAASSQVAS